VEVLMPSAEKVSIEIIDTTENKSLIWWTGFRKTAPKKTLKSFMLNLQMKIVCHKLGNFLCKRNKTIEF
jgi:hypothetical protein